ncbi:hypothetical protein, partial [Escherichia coli]|uniref:hypothetical protein n=1 Tax=Escherichia coli TaxID=562 RepID=UPI00200C9DBC
KDSNGTINPKIIDELLKASKWKRGASAYYNLVNGTQPRVNPAKMPAPSVNPVVVKQTPQTTYPERHWSGYVGIDWRRTSRLRGEHECHWLRNHPYP